MALVTAASEAPPGGVSLVPCPVLTITGLECPGCGMTRACVAIARGELSAAWSLHPFAFLLIPLALLWALFPERSRGLWWRVPALVRSTAVALALACAVGLWLSRVA